MKKIENAPVSDYAIGIYNLSALYALELLNKSYPQEKLEAIIDIAGYASKSIPFFEGERPRFHSKFDKKILQEYKASSLYPENIISALKGIIEHESFFGSEAAKTATNLLVIMKETPDVQSYKTHTIVRKKIIELLKKKAQNLYDQHKEKLTELQK